MTRRPGKRGLFSTSAVALIVMGMAPLGCEEAEAPPLEAVAARLDSLLLASGGEVSVYFKDLGGSDSLLLAPDVRMHAASTMKVPVMMRLFLDRDEGRISLEDSLEVTTTFYSIVDGSPFVLPSDSDTETGLYQRVGQKVGYREMMEAMITRSSNLATNILIREAEPGRVTALMRTLGADSIEVLRGVEDLPAFQAGLSNTTTARDLGVIFSALARGEVGSEASGAEMTEILLRQHFDTMIPAGLPEGISVAHKTGGITGISHDAGIVYPPQAPPFVLVILTRGFQSWDEADALGARITTILWRYHLARHGVTPS